MHPPTLKLRRDRGVKSNEIRILLRWVRFCRAQNDTKAHKTTKSYMKSGRLGVNQAVFRGVIFRGLRVWCYVEWPGREFLTL